MHGKHIAVVGPLKFGMNKLLLLLLLFICLHPQNGEQYITHQGIHVNKIISQSSYLTYKIISWNDIKISQCFQYDTACIMAVYGVTYKFKLYMGQATEV